MAAGLGFKDFTTGEVLTAADVDGYLMQGIWVFASAAARDAAVTSPQEGNACYLKDTDVIQVYTGSAWAAQSASNPISANIVDAKGDLIVGTAADTVSRLAVGTNGYTLVADSAEATGLKWAAASSGGMTLLDTLTLSGASTVTSSTFSSAYNQIFIYIKGAYSASGAPWLNLRINGDSASNYSNRYIIGEGTSVFVNGNNSTTEYPMGTVTTSTSDPEKAFAYITIMKPSDTDIFFISSECQSFTVGQSTRNWQSTGTYDASAALTSITIFTTVNFSGGTAAIYGVK